MIKQTQPSITELKAMVLRGYRRGVSLDRLAEHANRSVSTVRRWIHDDRLAALHDRKIDYIDNPDFKRPDAEQVILGPAPQRSQRRRVTRPPAGLPPYLASLYEIPLLSAEEETHYFRQLNYLKYRAAQTRDQFGKRVTAEELDRVEDFLDQAEEVRNLLISRNLRLVVSIAKKYIRPDMSFFELVSDGNVSLMRAVDGFDYGRGFKFSTYATWAIRRNFSRTIPAEHTHRDRFRTGTSDAFTTSCEDRSNPWEELRINEQQQEALSELLDALPQRDRDVVVQRFGLKEGTEPQTLEQIGQNLGVSKERIRQIESRALRRLRDQAERQQPEIPGI